MYLGTKKNSKTRLKAAFLEYPYWKLQKELLIKYLSQIKNQEALLKAVGSKCIGATARNSAFWAIIQVYFAYFMRYKEHRLEISPPINCDTVDSQDLQYRS